MARVRAATELLRIVSENVRNQVWVAPAVIGGAIRGEMFHPNIWYITEWIAVYGRATGAYTLDELVRDAPMGDANSRTPVICAQVLFNICGYVGNFQAQNLAGIIASYEIPAAPLRPVQNQGFKAQRAEWDVRNIPGLVGVGENGGDVVFMVPPSAYAVLQYALLYGRRDSVNRTALLGDILGRIGFRGNFANMIPDHIDAVRWLADYYKTPQPQQPAQVAAGIAGGVDQQQHTCGLLSVQIYSWDYIRECTRLREEQQANAELRGNAGVSVDVLSTLKMEVRVAKEAHAALQRDMAAQIQAERAGAEATRRMQVARMDELQREVRVQTARSATLAQLTRSLEETLAMVHFRAPVGGNAAAAAPAPVGGNAAAPPNADVSMRQARCGTVFGLFEPLSLLVPFPDAVPGHIEDARRAARSVCEYIFYSTPQLWMMFLTRLPVKELIRTTHPDAQFSPIVRAIAQVVNNDHVNDVTRATARNMFPPNNDMDSWRQLMRNEAINAPILDELHIGAADPRLGQMRRIGWYGGMNNAAMNGFMYSRDNDALIAVEIPQRAGGTEIHAFLQRRNNGNMPRITGARMIVWNPV